MYFKKFLVQYKSDMGGIIDVYIDCKNIMKEWVMENNF